MQFVQKKKKARTKTHTAAPMRPIRPTPGLPVCGNQNHLPQTFLTAAQQGGFVWNRGTKQWDVPQLVPVPAHAPPPTSQKVPGRFRKRMFSSDPEPPIPTLWEHQAALKQGCSHTAQPGMGRVLLSVVGSLGPAMPPWFPQLQINNTSGD